MSRHFRPWKIDQTQLLPSAIADYVPADHLAQFGLVQRLKWRWGGPPKPPNLKGRERLREAATTDDELRNKNTDLGNKINEVLRNHPELWGVADEIALKQGLWVQVGTSFLERVQANLQERARAIIELCPDLERLFDA